VFVLVAHVNDVLCFQVVKMTRSNDIQFCKGFWGLAENSFMHVCLFFSLTLVVTVLS